MVSKSIVLTILLCFVAVLNTTAEDEGFYCKIEQEKFRICRRCPHINGVCPNDPVDGCHCENIELFEDGKYVGGSKCENEFCFVSLDKAYDEYDSPCSDVDYDTEYISEDDKSVKFWHHFENDIVRSKAACENKQEIDIGNEESLKGVQIAKDYLYGLKETTVDGILILEEDKDSQFTFLVNDHKECMAECKDQCGKCGAWSFDNTTGMCFLHTVDACCGQKLKQVNKSNFTSGYYCNQCWSTMDEIFCKSDECSAKERLTEHPLACEGVGEQSAGAETPQYTSSAGVSRVVRIPVNDDVCACERREFKNRGGCRCVKQTCKNAKTNPDGRCNDKQRCLKRKLNITRNPFC